MSRIGYSPIVIPEGVTFTIEGDTVRVKGPKGEMVQRFDPEFKLKQEENKYLLERPTDQKRHKSLHGLYRSLINNAVMGVTQGNKIALELVGVGYRASLQGNVLELSLGYSHSIHMQIPPEVKVSVESAKGKNPVIVLESVDKQLVGQVAAKIKSLRKVEPYKGKGIREVGVQVRRKAGKTIAK